MRSILITGGTRGIGAAISEKFSKNDRVVALFNKDVEAAKNFEEKFKVSTIKCDMSSLEDINNNIDKIFEMLNGRIDVFIHNAGIVRDATLKKMPIESWIDVINTNLNSCFYLCRHIAPKMMEQKSGSIIFISSVNARKGQFGQTNYCASKAGMIGFMKALALECAIHNVTVNAVAPGYIKTEMLNKVPENILNKILENIPLGRLGKCEEIANLVFEIAQNQYITGGTFDINGGLYLD
jgi:acetoacetyl-CoA reductase